ncbi:MAG: response regulator [Deltaproteobacteria bacterium]|nr:response regulator [Deltaproteobacteria bacterium]MBW2537869.1 response regulator [Deltaproteobacteria bacterium]
MATEKQSYKVEKMLELLPAKLSRQVVGSLVGCVHCGMCHEACHYVLTNPDNPKMTPSYKADQLRKIFKQHHDWTGRVFPWWVKASTPMTDEDLEELKDIAFGTCTNCRRCTFNCPMGVDTATLNRIMRGLLTRVGVMPEGVRVVSKDTWEIGNQMGVLKEDYVDTIEWLSEELVDEVEDDAAEIPIDKKGAEVVYTINPREVKYDPRTITNAALIFYAAGEDWTMPSFGWDQTNFGLFSGDDAMGAASFKHLEEKFKELEGKRLVISECGHGYRSTRCEGPNWSKTDQDFIMESSVITMLRYIKEGRIVVDKKKNSIPVTFHDSCNNARSCGFYEEPRELLELVCDDFREMHPNRTENYCCTGGGGAMSMSEYTPRRLKSAKIKADQIKETGAKIVVTSCHNCVDGLGDLIKHYKLGCEVKQLVDLVAEALVLEECAVKKKAKKAAEAEADEEKDDEKVEKDEVSISSALKGRSILVVDDEDDVRTFLVTVLQDAGAETFEASDGDEALEMARKHKPDLITLDLSMPGKDGVEAFVEMREDDEVGDIPVCVVTGHPEFRKVIYDRPATPPDGYMDKPVEEEALVRNLRRILETKKKD